MPLNVSYSVNRADRMRFAAEFDRLSKPATFKQQQEWAEEKQGGGEGARGATAGSVRHRESGVNETVVAV